MSSRYKCSQECWIILKNCGQCSIAIAELLAKLEWTVPLGKTCRDYHSRLKGCCLILSGTSKSSRAWYPFENATWLCSSDSSNSLFYLSTTGQRTSPRHFPFRRDVPSSMHFTIASEAIWICLIAMELYPLYLRFAYRDLSMSPYFYRSYAVTSIESVQAPYRQKQHCWDYL